MSATDGRAVSAAGATDLSACDTCLRRTWLLGALAGSIEIAWVQRRAVRDVLALDDESLLDALGGDGNPRRERLDRDYAEFDAARARAEATAAGLAVLCRHHPSYPPALRTGPGEPAALHIAGDPGAVAGEAVRPTVAMVGARRASEEGLEAARAIARGLSAAGVSVVSGLALGIDSAAHAGALAGPSPTVAVLGSGADRPTPGSRVPLARRIVERGGCLVSEMPPGFSPFRWCFPARNRIIAALADLTLIVEAAERSGSLITADFAHAFGRDVAAVPGRAVSPRTRGSNGLLRDGAAVVLDAADVLELVAGPASGRAVGPPPARPALEPRLASLLEAVASGCDTVSALVAAGREIAETQVGLAELELLGRVRLADGGRYVATM